MNPERKSLIDRLSESLPRVGEPESVWCGVQGHDLRAAVKALAEKPALTDEQAPRSVADIPDAELLRRVVRNLTRSKPGRKEFAWAAVSKRFGLGSTYSAQLCRRFGLDPDAGADIK